MAKKSFVDWLYPTAPGLVPLKVHHGTWACDT